MESNARVKGNVGIAHAAAAKPYGIVHRVPEPRLRSLIVLCVQVVCRWRGSLWQRNGSSEG